MLAGHVDLRAHPDPGTNHRALLGMGVHRDRRGRGLGRRLLEVALAWAAQESFAWVDLRYLAGNEPAARLYRSAGFELVATIEDMFRIDGVSVADVWMTRSIR